MKIISFKAENFKRLVCVQITPKGNVIKLTGKNAQGKSSIIDAIWCACGGADVMPEQPIRKGEDHALIELDFGELKITRRFTLKGSSLTVENAEGAIFRSPQKVIDELIGKLSFDPMHFMHMSDKEQFETLATYAGVDFSDVDIERKKYFEDRTVVNRQGKDKRAEVNAAQELMKSFFSAEDVGSETTDEELVQKIPDEELVIFDLANELTEANEHNRSLVDANNAVSGSEQDIKKQEQMIEDADFQMKQLKAVLDAQTKGLDAQKTKLKAMKPEINVLELSEKIESAEQINTSVRAKKDLSVKSKALEQLLIDSKALTSNIETCNAEREKMIAESELPVTGLSFGDDVVLLNEIPVKQASSAEQLEISIAVAMSMNPKLKVIRVQDGSLLDSDSMKMLEDMATDKDFQFWVEKVDESGSVGVVIEDGQVKSDNQ